MNASLPSLVSCRQTTSGRRSSSHGSSRGTRILAELTFQVAIRTTPKGYRRAPPAYPVFAVRVEARLSELGLVLPEAVRAPADIRLPFAPVRLQGHRAFVAGHGPTNPDGSLA